MLDPLPPRSLHAAAFAPRRRAKSPLLVALLLPTACTAGSTTSGASISRGAETTGTSGATTDHGGSSSGGSASGRSGASSAGGGHTSSGSTSQAGGADATTSNSCTSADAVCQSSNTGCNVGSYYLYDNQWNCGIGAPVTCGPESAYGCTNSDGTVAFVVTSNQPAGNTAVLSYPAMQDNFNDPLLSSFKEITATFEETSPHVGDYEVAWDCWFNDQANELMIWVDNYNQTPAGSKVASNVPLGGRTYDVWWSPSGGGAGYVVFDANTTFTSGTVDLLQIFNYADSHGWLGTGPTVGQLSFGVEVCSTNGEAATWTFDDYSITTGQ